MITALLSFWLAFQVNPELRQHVEAGLAAKRAGDLDTAIREFHRVTELAPQMAAAHVNLGAVYYDKRDYTNAVPSLKRALELNGDLPGAHEMLGVALLAQGYASEAATHLERAQSAALLGVALLEAGRTREAIDKLEATLEQRPGDPDLLYYLGQAHARLSRQAFDLLTQSHPDSDRSHQALGEAALETGNREAAEKHFRAALEKRPDLRGVHLALGELYLRSGDLDSATREFREEAARNPGSAVAAFQLGSVLLDRGDLQPAMVELARADKLQPGMPETLLALGKGNAAMGNSEAAEKLFRRVLEQERTSTLAETAHYQLGQIYRKLGRTADAESEMKRFQELRKQPRRQR